LKFKADFHSKMSVCRRELGRGLQPPNPPTISTLDVRQLIIECRVMFRVFRYSRHNLDRRDRW